MTIMETTFTYAMDLHQEGEVYLSQRVDKHEIAKPLLGTQPSFTELRMHYNTEPSYSDNVDPQIVVLDISFDDTGEHPNCYLGQVTAHLDRSQLTQLRDFATFLLTMLPNET